jgi:hypothetical protein
MDRERLREIYGTEKFEEVGRRGRKMGIGRTNEKTGYRERRYR